MNLTNNFKSLVIAIAKKNLFPIERAIYNYQFFDLLFSRVSEESLIRQEICSYILCHATQTTDGDMTFFSYIYDNANLDIDHLHVWSKEPDLVCNRSSDGKYVQDFSLHSPKRLLNIAAMYGNHEVLKFLLPKQPSREVYTVAGEERQVLFDLIHGEKMHKGNAVSQAGFGEIMQLLLKHGIDPRTRIRDCTPLEYAYVSYGEGGMEYEIYLESMPTSNVSPYCYRALNDYMSTHYPSMMKQMSNYLCHFIWNNTKSMMETFGEYLGYGPE